ncbi:MAG TPA: TIGR03857 family LLM class F420-dependent oxidoreductase, partial [Gammaproteobacteria bacterium]|nr:TIGR03857 family LLM class F420-dependent oxidoreductase [Gammaproteobacteria bacterium]
MYPTYNSKFPELGFYGLPGHSRAPRDILRQAQDAEALGIGNIMISERADFKEISALCGAVAGVTNTLYIGTSGTNLNTRHPIVTASMGSTLNRLSEGRFALGLAKGVKLRWQALNVDFPNFAHERSFVELMRKLWRGEQVIGHDSPLGQYPVLQLAPYVSEDIPLM